MLKAAIIIKLEEFQITIKPILNPHKPLLCERFRIVTSPGRKLIFHADEALVAERIFASFSAHLMEKRNKTGLLYQGLIYPIDEGICPVGFSWAYDASNTVWLDKWIGINFCLGGWINLLIILWVQKWII